MIFSKFSLFALVSWFVCVSSAALSIADLTDCGLRCLLITIPEVGCSLTNTSCQCSSRELPQITTACLLKNCTMHDSLVLSKVTASVCELPHQSHSRMVIATMIALFTITSGFILLRLYSKKWVSNSLGLDDWLISSALALSSVTTSFTVKMSKGGFGKHLWDLNDGDLLQILRDFYISEILYVVILSLTKISILVFYLRIFPQKWFRIAAYANIGMITISSTTIVFLTIFQCHPLQYFWDKDIKGAMCLDLAALAYANNAMSILQDVLIVMLPIPVIHKLRMDRRKKAGVAFMFAVGSFGCVVSMVRLKSLISFGNSVDPTWDYTYAVIWTALELAVAIICACFPAIRRLLKPFFPNIFDSIAAHSNEQHPPGFRRPSQSWRSKHATAGEAFVELQNSNSDTSRSRTEEEETQIQIQRERGKGQEDQPKEALGLGINVRDMGKVVTRERGRDDWA